MSWHYSQAPVEGFSLPTYLDGIPSAEWKWNDTPERFSSNDNETKSSNHSPSGTTSEPSTGNRGEATLTSSREGSLVKTSPQRVKVEDLPESVQDFGSRCSELLTRYGLDLSSRKTVRTCVPVDSAPSSKDLPAWGMTCGGACWELGTSVRIINATECGYWATPTKTQAGGTPEDFIRRKGRHAKDARVTDLALQVRAIKEGKRHFLPRNHAESARLTAKSADGPATYVRKFPTPRATDGSKGTRTSDGAAKELARGKNVDLSTAIGGGALNPTWVEWLMGWPLGWTELQPLEMDRFRQWQEQHGKFSQKDLPKMSNEKQHKKYSPSGASRWLNCHASLQYHGKDDGASEYAAEGTAAHALGQRCYLLGCDPGEFLGEEIEGFEVTQEMVESIEIYLETIESVREELGATRDECHCELFMESELSSEFGGTADFVIAARDAVAIIDFKYGSGVNVQAENNLQLLCYLYLALERFYLPYFESWGQPVLVVVQPRTWNHEEKVKRWEPGPDEWKEFLEALREVIKNPGGQYVAGDHCRWCPGKAH